MKATLTYHSIDDSGSPISVPGSAFDAHLRWLTSGRVQVLPLAQLFDHPESSGDAVAVTFDDGFLNIRDAVERLADHGIPATIFVVSERVGTTNEWGGKAARGIPTLPLLGWADLERLLGKGAVIEGHTRTHRALTGLPADVMEDEIAGCRADLLSRLGVSSTQFAYPYGIVDDEVAERAARHYRCGHTTEFGALRSAERRLLLPRLDMYYFSSPRLIEEWGSPEFSRRISWIRTRRRVKGWVPFWP